MALHQLNTHPLTRFFRLLCAALHLLLGVALSALVVPFIRASLRQKLTRWWSAKLLHIFNIQLSAFGELPNAHTRQTFFVANHVSWLDIFAINAVFPVRFIAKSEVNQWPVLGFLVRKSGTLFINRNAKKDALRIVDIAAENLKQGENFCFFPEGTTTDGTMLAPFKSSVLQAAVDSGAHVQAIAVRYPNNDGTPNPHMAYAGDTSLWESVKNIVTQPAAKVELHFLTPIEIQKTTRQDVSNKARAAIAQTLGLS